jgi:integrase
LADVFKKQSVRYYTPDGKRCTPNTPGASRTVELSRKWYGTVSGKAVPLCRDKGAAQKLLNKLLTDATMRAHGVGDPYEEHRGRPLADHLADFGAALRAKGDTAKHVKLALSRLQAAFDGMGAVWLADLDAGKAGDWLTTLRADREPVRLPEGQELFKLAEVAALLGVKPAAVSKAVQRNRLQASGKGKARRFPRATVQDLADRAARGASPETVNHYARALRAFGRWLDRSNRWPSNPFDTLALLNVTTDRRHDRRELAAYEMRRLLEVTRASARGFRGLAGPDRAALYLTACGTGFRVRALAGLTPADFALAADMPAVVLPARLAKNKKAKVQPLAADVADALRAYLDGRPRNKPVWPGTWNVDAAEMLRADLEAAGIPYAVEGPDGPLFADFHALRHTYLTLGGRAGIDLRTLQELAGHSNPNLTARYSHRRLHDLAGAVERLPSIVPAEKGAGAAAALPATGTDDTPAPPRERAKEDKASSKVGFGCSVVARPPSNQGHLEASPGTEERGTEEGVALTQPLTLASDGISRHLQASVSRLGLEPRTYGLTYRTGFHPPARGRCGLDFIISPGTTRWGATRKVSEDPACGSFLLIAQSGGLSRLPSLLSWLLPCTAYRRLKGIPANGVVLRRASRPGHSC